MALSLLSLKTKATTAATYWAKQRQVLVDIKNMLDVHIIVSGRDHGATAEVVDANNAELCTAGGACIDAWSFEVRVPFAEDQICSSYMIVSDIFHICIRLHCSQIHFHTFKYSGNRITL